MLYLYALTWHVILGIISNYQANYQPVADHTFRSQKSRRSQSDRKPGKSLIPCIYSQDN